MQLIKKRELTEALSIFINQIVYRMKGSGTDVITLSLGEAYFDIPRFDAGDIDFIKGIHYCDSRGLPGLRRRIADFYRNEYGVNADPECEVLISAGSKAVIYMIMLALTGQGDEVLVPEPAWLSYPEHIKLAGGVPVNIPYDVPVSGYRKYITPRTRAVIINNPNNPGGKRYTQEEFEDILAMCRENDLYMISDEAYSSFVPDGSGFISAALADPGFENTLVVNSLSKNFGVSGWRIGYLLARKDIVDEILKYNEHIITCAPAYLQMYMERYFDDFVNTTAPQIRAIMEKRKRTEEFLKRTGLSFIKGDSTFYFLIDCAGYRYSKMKLCLYLLFRYNIATVPGEAYGSSVSGYIRIGIGTASDAELEYAFNIIKKVIDSNEYDEMCIKEGAERCGADIRAAWLDSD